MREAFMNQEKYKIFYILLDWPFPPVTQKHVLNVPQNGSSIYWKTMLHFLWVFPNSLIARSWQPRVSGDCGTCRGSEPGERECHDYNHGSGDRGGRKLRGYNNREDKSGWDNPERKLLLREVIPGQDHTARTQEFRDGGPSWREPHQLSSKIKSLRHPRWNGGKSSSLSAAKDWL